MCKRAEKKTLNAAFKIFLLGTIILGAYCFHRAGFLQALISRIQGLGSMAPVVFLFIYTVTAVFFMPSFLLTFAGGFLFDFWTASALSILGCGLGALSAFLIGRYLAHTVAVSLYLGRLAQAELRRGE